MGGKRPAVNGLSASSGAARAPGDFGFGVGLLASTAICGGRVLARQADIAFDLESAVAGAVTLPRPVLGDPVIVGHFSSPCSILNPRRPLLFAAVSAKLGGWRAAGSGLHAWDPSFVVEAKALALRLARPLLDFALPPRCPGCGTITDEPHLFCFSCWSGLEFLGPPCCARCAHPFEYESGPGALCGGCSADPPDYDQLRAAVAYGEVSRKVALRLKYGGRPGHAETLARLMVRHLPDRGEIMLAPVPLHRWRIWKRGYNQAALIARALARRSGTTVRLDLLERIKATPSLKGKNPRQRREAVAGAFRLLHRYKEEVRGRSVILVDDVYTSGATANACARILKRAGAARVDVLCWARVVRSDEH